MLPPFNQFAKAAARSSVIWFENYCRSFGSIYCRELILNLFNGYKEKLRSIIRNNFLYKLKNNKINY